MYTPEISNSDISRITTQDGEYHFTIGKVRYRTDKNGEGLWRYQASGTNMMDGEKVFKTKDLSKQLGIARLSFAGPEDMERYLNVTPGSVTVLALMNDPDNHVQLVIDKSIAEARRVSCHPCINTSTIWFTTEDLLKKFLPAVHHEPIFVDLPDPEVEALTTTSM